MLDRIGSQAKDLLRSQPSLLRTLGMGVCLLILGFMVLRPLGRQAVKLLEPPLLPAPALATATRVDAPLQLDESGQPAEPAETAAPGSRLLPPIAGAAPDAQNVFDRVTEHIRLEPAGSARLIQNWIGGPEDNE